MSSAKYSLLSLLLAAAACNGQSSQAMRQNAPEPTYPPPQVVPPSSTPDSTNPDCVQPKLPEGTTLKVSLNIKGGQMLQLSDNSNWMISPDDITYSSSWLTPAQITISASGDPDFPCLLTNMQTNTSVKAKRVATVS